MTTDPNPQTFHQTDIVKQQTYSRSQGSFNSMNYKKQFCSCRLDVGLGGNGLVNLKVDRVEGAIVADDEFKLFLQSLAD